MRLQTEATASFARGMQDSAAATAYREDECALLLNGRVSPEGTARVRGGSRRAHALPLNGAEQAWGATEFTTAAGVKQWIAFAGAKAFLSIDEGATWTETAAAMPTGYWSFAVATLLGAPALIAANGGAEVYRWDGATWSAIVGMPAGVKHLASFGRRLWIAGHDGVVVQASEIDVPENLNTVDGALYIRIDAGEGNEITGLYETNGRLLVFKRGSTAFVDGFGSDDLQVQAGSSGLSSSVGCVAHRTIRGVGDDGVAWLSERGLEHWTPGRGLRRIATGLRAFFEQIAWGNIESAPGIPCALYLPGLDEYRVALPTFTARNDRTVRVNMTTGAAYLDRHAPRVGGTLYVDDDGALAYTEEPTRYEARVVDGAIALATDGRAGAFVGLDETDALELLENLSEPAALFAADRGEQVSQPVSIGYDGIARYLEDGATDDADTDGTGGRPIGFLLVTRPLLYGAPFLRKRGRLAHLLVDASESATVSVAVRGDGVPGRAHDASVAAATNRQPRQVRARVGVRGRTLQVEVWTSDQLSIAGVSLQAEVMREVGS